MCSNALIFGGTFDPVHLGHMQVAAHVQSRFKFDKFLFLPCKLPVHKDRRVADAAARVAMLEFALEEAPIPHAEVDCREINRHGPSFMVVTLADYRQEMGKDVALVLLMGADAFAQLPGWHQWDKLLSLTNFLVVERPGSSPYSQVIEAVLREHEVFSEDSIKHRPYGAIFRYNAGQFEQASSDIRALLKKSKKNEQEGVFKSQTLPESVKEYIDLHGLYNAS